jgi:hypothetical protein
VAGHPGVRAAPGDHDQRLPGLRQPLVSPSPRPS